MSSEGNDYIFLKKIEVLYVNADISFQEEIMEKIGGYISLTTLNSLESAIESLESNDYDLILCDMSFPAELLKEFFNRFSKIIPIVATSSSKDPKVAYNAARLGAKDYIPTTRGDFNRLSKSLHNVHLTWIKDRDQKDSLQLLHDPKMRTILRDLIGTDLPIYQTISSSLVNEVPIDDTIQKAYNIQTNDILAKYPYVLNLLSKMDFVTKEPLEQTLACPNCRSVNIFAHYFCEKCKSNRFKAIFLRVHSACGRYSILDETTLEKKLLCSYCGIYYENSPSNYNETKGFRCSSCHKTFTNPIVSYSCKNCNHEGFGINEGIWLELFMYKLQQKSINKIKKSFSLLIELEDLLQKSGFTVKQYEKIEYGDGSFGPYELTAYKDKMIFIFIILNTDLQYNLRRIFEIDVLSKNMDKNTRSFAIAFYEPPDVVLKLLERFEIMPLIALNANEIVKIILNTIRKNYI